MSQLKAVGVTLVAPFPEGATKVTPTTRQLLICRSLVRREEESFVACPQSYEYNEAIQNLAATAGDEELRRGQPALDALGVPSPCSGGFAERLQGPLSSNGQDLGRQMLHQGSPRPGPTLPAGRRAPGQGQSALHGCLPIPGTRPADSGRVATGRQDAVGGRPGHAPVRRRVPRSAAKPQAPAPVMVSRGDPAAGVGHGPCQPPAWQRVVGSRGWGRAEAAADRL